MAGGFPPPRLDSRGRFNGVIRERLDVEDHQVDASCTAISHYQFETIHPFLDGNGSIDRLFIPLYLISHSLLAKPSLYLSDFFERNRASYCDALMRVRIGIDLWT